MVESDAEIIEVIQRTPDVKSFLFRSEGVDFKPGQFLQAAIDVEGARQAKYFSFSSSPTEKGYIEFTKRITQSPFSKTLNIMKPGDRARLKMPFGKFTFEGEHQKIALLSGGIGITPIRSICKYAADKRLATDIVLLYGNRTEADIIFRDDFERMRAENKNLRVVHTLTGSEAQARWKGRRGHIEYRMLTEEMPDYADRIFYICGPPGMVASLTDILTKDLNIGKDKIMLENFAGYA